MLNRYVGFFLLLILLLGAFQACGQKFDLDTLQYNGPSAEYINLVILGDGYTAGQLQDYLQDARAFTDHLFTQAPFQAYKSYFNVFAIQVISAESGVKHPGTAPDCGSSGVPISNPNNYLGTTFDKLGIHRLVVPTTIRVTRVLINNFPEYDQVVVLANTSHYGGSGGAYATATVHAASNDIAVHELGHSFAGLADEYWPGLENAEEKPNMTQEKDPSRIKWKNWLTPDSGIGIHPYPGQSWYKPTQHACKMEALDKAFCAVCAEAIIEHIHTLTDPVRSFGPDNEQPIPTTPQSHPFFVSLQKANPSPNTLKSVWQLNGVPVASNTDSVLISPNKLEPGLNNLSVSLLDTTSRTRSGTHPTDHQYTVNWTIDNGVVLPVTLTSFGATAGAAGVTLTWTTATEENNDRFEIERSSNALDWQVVGLVKGKGTSYSRQAYSFLDASALPDLSPTLYYRLRQWDNHGLSEYSKAVAVRLKPLPPRIRLLGNPTTEHLQLEASGLPMASLRLGIYAPDGSTVQEWPLPSGQPSRLISLPVAGLAPGVYIYSLLYQGQVLDTGRFVKQEK